MLRGRRYVPILRWKRAEMEALRDLEPEDRDHILPLVELLPLSFQAPKNGPRKGKKPPLEEVFSLIAKDVLQFWGNGPFFLDSQRMESSIPRIRGLHPIAFASHELRAVRACPIFVCSLNDSSDLQLALRSIRAADKRGACLRVLVPEVMDPEFPDRIATYLKKNGLSQSSVDLLLDYQAMEGDVPNFPRLLGCIPEIRNWRTLIVACGAFPKDLTNFLPARHDLPRRDWTFYRDQVLEERLPRNPLFSDYTIQFGRYVEPPENSNPSASIRYTSGDLWVVMRGEGLRNKDGPKNEQYPALAQLLCETDAFCGGAFSKGDDYLYQKFLKIGGNGTPRTWLRAGINHHVTFVARQLGGTDLRAIPNYRGDRPIESIRPTRAPNLR